jgi:hypothetical protein
MSQVESFLQSRSNISTRYFQNPLAWFVKADPRYLDAPPPRYRGRDARGEDVMMRVPEHQRDYVWKLDKQRGLIASVFRGFPIPSLIMTEDHRNRNSIQDGQQRLETLWRYYNDMFSYCGKFFKDLSEDEKKAFLDYMIPVTDITGATPEEEAEIYDLLNQGVSLSHGEKFWNRRSKPLVALAERLFLTPGTGLNALATEVFGDYLAGKDPRHRKLENAIAYVAGAVYGVDRITTSYPKLAYELEFRKLSNETMIRIDEARSALAKSRLEAVLNIYKAADGIQGCANPTKKKAQWKIGLYSAYMLHTVIYSENDPELFDDLKRGWIAFLCQVRNRPSVEKLLYKDMSKSNNITPERLEKGYKNLLSMIEEGFDVEEGQEVSEEESEGEE